MNNGWIFTLLILVLASGMVYATAPIVSVTNSVSAVVNPAIAAVPLTFTLQNPNTGTETDPMNVQIVASTDNVFDGSDVVIAASADASTFCNGATDYTTAQNCNYSWTDASAVAEGTTFLIVHVTLTTGANETHEAASNSFLLDKTVPSASITSPANAATVNTLFPVFTITGDAGTGSNLTIGQLTVNGNPHVLSFTSNVATFTAVSQDNLVAGQTYTATLDSVVDGAGNINTTPSSITFTISSTAPSNPTASATTNYTNDKTPSITISAEDTGAIGGLVALIKCDGGSAPTSKSMSGTSIVVDDFDVTTGPNCTNSDGERTLKIKVKNALGVESTEVGLVIKYDGTDPATPGSVGSTSVDDTDVTITWNASSDPVSGIDKYYLYRGTSNSFSSASEIGTSTSTSKEATGLTKCTTYYFWVKAKDNAGNESDESSAHQVTTTGCSSGNNNSGSGSGSGSGGSGGSGGTGGGGGGATCNVTFTVPKNIYAGETIQVKAVGSNYANGLLYGFEAGKANTEIKKTPTAAKEWEGQYTVSGNIGKLVTFRFKTDGCISSAETRTIKDPKTKIVEAEAPVKKDPATPTTTTPTSGTVLEPQQVVEPSAVNVALSIEKIGQLMTFAGFNADNAEQKTKIEQLISGMGLVETIQAVPAGDGTYYLEIVLKLVNTANVGTIKVVQQVPKSFAETASGIEANYPMTVLMDDPLVQFEISDLSEGQTVEIRMKSKETFTKAKAEQKVDNLKEELNTPPLLFASGTAKANEGSGGLAAISGLVGAAGVSAPFILGFVLVLGLIFVSVRVVRGSVEGSNNPILRSASQANQRGGRIVTAPVNGKKRFAQNKGDAA